MSGECLMKEVETMLLEFGAVGSGKVLVRFVD